MNPRDEALRKGRGLIGEPADRKDGCAKIRQALALQKASHSGVGYWPSTGSSGSWQGPWGLRGQQGTEAGSTPWREGLVHSGNPPRGSGEGASAFTAH